MTLAEGLLMAFVAVAIVGLFVGVERMK